MYNVSFRKLVLGLSSGYGMVLEVAANFEMVLPQSTQSSKLVLADFC